MLTRKQQIRKLGLAYTSGYPPKKTRNTGPSSTVVDAVLERACYCCEVCGSPCADQRGMDWSIHHRRPRGMGGTRWAGINLPSNLMLVCGSGTTLCHGVIENYRAGAVAAGWLVLSSSDPATVAVLITRDRWAYLTDDGTYVDAPPPAGVRAPYACPVCGTGYRTAEHAAGCADDHTRTADSDCPYLSGTGKCVTGCTTEPRCITGREA